MTTDRKLASVEQITAVEPVENSDNLDVVSILGWKVVTRRGEFSVGDFVVYFYIDSFLPLDDPRFAFLAPRGARKNPEGVEGHVLKTAKLRGVYSQGLVMSYHDFPEIWHPDGYLYPEDYPQGGYTSRIPGLEKWDPPIPAELAGSAKGPFPSAFRKTDEERIQNMPWVFEKRHAPTLEGGWVATEKIDGSSMTVYIRDGEHGVASRNWDIEDTSHNSMWKLARELDLFGIMADWAHRVDPSLPVAFQGEIFGPGIQGNPLQVKDVQFRLFTVQIAGSDVPRDMWPENVLALSVPVHDLPYPSSVEEALDQVENLKSLINPERPVEGVVWRNTRSAAFPNGARASWKAISQRYLLKHDR